MNPGPVSSTVRRKSGCCKTCRILAPTHCSLCNRICGRCATSPVSFGIEAQIGQFVLFFLGRSTPQEKQGLPLFTWLRSCSPVCTPTSLHSLVHSTPPLHVNIGSVVPALQLLHLLPINPDQPHHRQTRIRCHRLLSCCRGGGHSGLLACGACPPIAARRGSVRRHSP